MISAFRPRSRPAEYRHGINRDQSPLLAIGIPWLSVMIGSLTPWLPIIAPAPILPPLGLLILLTWRLLRPGLFPLWAGLPLGLFDDLFSGQPFGSGILLFSLVLLTSELIELRFPWRTFLLNWLLATPVIAAAILIAALASGSRATVIQLTVIAPQIILSIVSFPLVSRLLALLDRIRLMRVRRID